MPASIAISLRSSRFARSSGYRGRKDAAVADKEGKLAQARAEALADIAKMPDADRIIAEKIHEIVSANAPVLSARLWYGMPGWAKDGKVILFFQAASKFKTRYATLGFQHDAHLDEGVMWPVAFALTELTPAEEAKIAELVKRAVS